MTKHYLSTSEVAARIGVATGTLSRYKLPEPDVTVGQTRGWSEATIDAWHAARPGRGRWGSAPRGPREAPPAAAPGGSNRATEIMRTILPGVTFIETP